MDHQETMVELSPAAVSGSLTRILGAGLVYFIVVFATVSILGSVRVPLIEPRFAKFLATVLAAPLMIAAIVLAARSVTKWFKLAGRKVALLLVGVIAISLAMIADLCVGLFLSEMSFGEQLLLFMTPAGLTYLLLLAVFLAVPLVGDLWQSRV
jgi:hypothetical protein